MSGELIPRHRTGGRQLERRISGALDEVAARQLITERIIKAKAQVGEEAMYEVNYLMSLLDVVAKTNPAAVPAAAGIVQLTVAGISRTVAEFGGSL